VKFIVRLFFFTTKSWPDLSGCEASPRWETSAYLVSFSGFSSQTSAIFVISRYRIK